MFQGTEKINLEKAQFEAEGSHETSKYFQCNMDNGMDYFMWYQECRKGTLDKS